MLLIKTSVKLSPIHGLGLFTVERIRRGQAIWVFDAHVDSKISANDFEKSTESRRATVSHFAHQNPNKQWLLCGDGALFINHSDAPNGEFIFGDADYPQARDGVVRAREDIAAGGEITLHYLS